RVPSARRPYASARPLVSWHALVPFTFQIQVSHQTQEYPPNSSRLSREYNRAPRGAGWHLIWSGFAEPVNDEGSTMAIQIMDDTMTVETGNRVVATALVGERAARRGSNGAQRVARA